MLQYKKSGFKKEEEKTDLLHIIAPNANYIERMKQKTKTRRQEDKVKFRKWLFRYFRDGKDLQLQGFKWIK